VLLRLEIACRALLLMLIAHRKKRNLWPSVVFRGILLIKSYITISIHQEEKKGGKLKGGKSDFYCLLNPVSPEK